MSKPITSRQNSRVKEAAKLRDARQRKKQDRFVIDGVREIGRALDAGIEVDEAFLCPVHCTCDAAKVVATRFAPAATFEVTPEVFEKLNFGDRTDGIVVAAKTPQRTLDQLQLPERPIIAVLAGLEKPGNVGAILRTADGAGVDAVIVADAATDLFNPNTIRASAGTVFGRNIVTATTEEAIAHLRDWHLPIIATRPQATQLYTEVDYHGGAAIVLGSEAHGLSPQWQQTDMQGVQLNMAGIADSLNVSVTAGILFYEAQRQRAARD